MKTKQEDANGKESGTTNRIINKLKKLPLWSGWIINALAWVIFIGTSSHPLEILMGILCLLSFYIGFNKKHNTLMYFSIFDAIWMFAWGFGFFGSSIGVFDLIKIMGQIK